MVCTSVHLCSCTFWLFDFFLHTAGWSSSLAGMWLNWAKYMLDLSKKWLRVKHDLRNLQALMLQVQLRPRKLKTGQAQNPGSSRTKCMWRAVEGWKHGKPTGARAQASLDLPPALPSAPGKSEKVLQQVCPKASEGMTVVWPKPNLGGFAHASVPLILLPQAHRL